MKRSTIAVLVAVYMVLGVVAVAPFASWILTYGCGAEDDRLAASLAALGILDAHPAGATPQEGRSSSCENDDRITTVVQTYRASGPRAELLSFYREAAIRDGWTPPPEDDGEGVGCFTKSVGGRTVELSVWIPEAIGEEHADDYDVDVSSSPEGGGWC
ncbi:hypothetical protein [Microtetraspora niveoalba]|uniref:hypothetical protein n=1 Tax=Microtetraspora niveoalba TaxID=46175 RepID=UPI0012F89067|nr:hypothetical protein [Microtetraspora niveoalba]